MRERLIVNVGSLRYELDIISILTPLPPERKPKLAVLTPPSAHPGNAPIPRNERGAQIWRQPGPRRSV